MQTFLREVFLMKFPTLHLVFMEEWRFKSFICIEAMNKLSVIRDLGDRANVVIL